MSEADSHQAATQTSQDRIPRRIRRILAGFVILAIFFAITSFALPYGVQYGLERWFKSQGAAYSSIKSIRIGLFSGEFEINDLQVGVNNKSYSEVGRATIDFDWLPLFKKQLYIRTVELEKANLDVVLTKNGTLTLGPLTVSTSETTKNENDEHAAFTSQSIIIRDSKVHFRSDTLNLNIGIDQFQSGEMSTLTATTLTPVSLSGSINHADIKFTGKARPFYKNISLSGKLSVNNLSLSEYISPYLPEDIHLSANAAATLNTSLLIKDISSDKSSPAQPYIEYSFNGDIAFNKVELEDGRETPYKFAADKLSFHNVDISNTASDKIKITIGNGEIHTLRASGKSDVNATGLLLTTDSAQFSAFALTSPSEISLSNAILQQLSLSAPDSGFEYTRAASLKLQKLNANSKQLIINNLDMQTVLALRALTEPEDSHAVSPYVIQARQVSMRGLDVNYQSQTKIHEINLHDMVGRLLRQKDSHWKTLDKLPTTAKEAPAEKNTSKVIIDKLMIDGKSTISVDDESVSPALNTTLKIKNAILSNLDSMHPGKPAKFTLSVQPGEYSTIDMSGDLYPFKEKTNLTAKGKIVNLDMPPFSGYATEHLGYQLSSGHLDSDIQTQVTDDVINGNIKLKLNNLDIKPDNPEKMKALTQQLSISLDTALGMLRDDKNNIKLEVPIKGNINDPSFDFGDAINQAIGKAAKKAAISYLSYSLGPFGALIALSDIAKGISNSVTLKPVEYQPGKSAISQKDQEYLGYIAKLLQDRPQLRIKICGTATTSDRIALSGKNRSTTNEQLLALAKQRALTIMGQFIKKYSIKADRLFLCNPEISTEKDAKPLVKIGL